MERVDTLFSNFDIISWIHVSFLITVNFSKMIGLFI